MIRTINTKEITKNVKEMCIEANHYLSPDMDAAMKKATAEEKSELGKKILNAGKPENCRRRDDSNLSGYRNGSLFC